MNESFRNPQHKPISWAKDCRGAARRTREQNAGFVPQEENTPGTEERAQTSSFISLYLESEGAELNILHGPSLKQGQKRV